MAPERFIFSTVGANKIKCLRPRALFGLPLIDVRRCADSASVEWAIRQAWHDRTRELRDSQDGLRALGLEVEAVEEGSALALVLPGDPPNARVLIGEKEWEFWKEEDDPLSTAVLADSVKPVFDAGLVDLVESDHKITDEVYLIPTPGHTPGHVSVGISSRGEEAVITGDLLHHPIQCAHPEWKDIFDVDDALAHDTRVKFLERYADGRVLILGTHFVSPTAGRIVRDGSTWRFDV